MISGGFGCPDEVWVGSSVSEVVEWSTSFVCSCRYLGTLRSSASFYAHENPLELGACTDPTKTKMVKQPDGTSKVEIAYAEPDPLTTLENMTRVGFFVMGYNSGRLNYITHNL